MDILYKLEGKDVLIELIGIVNANIIIENAKIIITSDKIEIINEKQKMHKITFNRHQLMKVRENANKIELIFDGLQTANISSKS